MEYPVNKSILINPSMIWRKNDYMVRPVLIKEMKNGKYIKKVPYIKPLSVIGDNLNTEYLLIGK